MKKVKALIVAGGSGSRMGTPIKKQYIKLMDKEILAHTVEVFNNCSEIEDIIIVVAESEINYVKQQLVDKYGFDKVSNIVAGGMERQDSVYNGLIAAGVDTSYVVIHDGARPFIKESIISKCLKKAKEKQASIVAVPVKDTIKVCNHETHKVENTPQRNKLWIVQTPQIFEYDLLIEAYAYTHAQHLQVTDDSMIVEAFGKDVYIVEGDYTNIKVTTPEDLIIGEVLIKGKK